MVDSPFFSAILMQEYTPRIFTMFPIPEKHVPLWIQQYPALRKAMLVGLGSVFVLLLAQEVVRLKRELNEGSRFRSLNESIAHRLLDSAAVGLDRYYLVHGHYPSASGKYFLDSIKQFIMIESDEVYIYADTVNSEGKLIPLKKGLAGSIQFRQVEQI